MVVERLTLETALSNALAHTSRGSRDGLRCGSESHHPVRRAEWQPPVERHLGVGALAACVQFVALALGRGAIAAPIPETAGVGSLTPIGETGAATLSILTNC